MHSICPLYFSSLVITSEAVTRDKVVHAIRKWGTATEIANLVPEGHRNKKRKTKR